MANRPRIPARPQSSHRKPAVKVTLLVSNRAANKTPPVKSDRPSPLAKREPVGKRPARRHDGIKTFLLTTAILLGSAAIVAEGGWVSVQLIIDPGSVSWLGWLMPRWNRAPLSRYQTLQEVRHEAAAMGMTVGEVLPLVASATSHSAATNAANASNKELLVSILAPLHRCGSAEGMLQSTAGGVAECQSIVELRVYRSLAIRPPNSREPYLELVDRAAIYGPRESFVVAPLATTPVISPGTSDLLPLNKVSSMEGAKSSRLWFDLSGEWSRGSSRISYGQVVCYDPQQHQLYPLTHWTSPVSAPPRWQQVTGSADPELVVNQSVGLQPDFKLYQIKPGHAIDPVQLSEISIASSVLDSRAYENGLVLARHGLWTPALEWMQLAKRHRGSNWSAAAQAQLDLTAFHAQITKAQADRNWANPGQAVIANLIDGRWTKALQLLQTALRDGYQIEDLLAADADRLWNQVGAALSVDAQQPDVQAWGALVLLARRGREAAIAWLQQHNASIGALAHASLTATAPTIAVDSRLQQVLNLLNDTLLVAHPSRILGAVAPLPTLNALDWQLPQPNTPLELAAQQTWYRIQVSSFYDGQQWQRSPFTRLNLSAIGNAQQLWSLLGLTDDAQIQLIVWGADAQPQTIAATIKAVRVQGGTLQLLASGANPDQISFAVAAGSPRPLAMTTTTVQWAEPDQTLTLAELAQQQPQWMATLLPALGRTQPGLSTRSPEAMLQTVGSWSVQLIDLTGDHQPEAIVTLTSNQVKRRSLIFSDQGALIYSELGSEAGQSFTAIANDGNGPALLVENHQNYSLLRWSVQHQHFE